MGFRHGSIEVTYSNAVLRFRGWGVSGACFTTNYKRPACPNMVPNGLEVPTITRLDVRNLNLQVGSMASGLKAR